MDWFGAGVDWPLITVRAIHFAASAVITGTLVFRTWVARPALPSEQAIALGWRSQTLRVAWIALAVTLLSGAGWLLLQAVSMSGLPPGEAMTSQVLSTVLNETQFGVVTEIRSVLAIILATALAFDRFALADRLALAAAVGLTASIAWTGHAGSTLGELGNLHLAADALHLVAAAGWIGGLVALSLLLAAVRRHGGASLARDAAQRFSTLGIVSVATLAVTGLVNSWILVGSFRALPATEYGQVLMLKLIVFAAMLVFAGVNRFALTPRLVVSSGNDHEAVRKLMRNSVVEIALGLAIFAIVGVLGTLHPAIHLS
ncbi:copper homeostasis membrane protein CopD [Bradyrhizobium erythrophlei]|jgi:putative copper resistance protein D|uniref:Putative copper resistance protein D n=1 Tax=Bradyrhizobium erythrophlei TaxID=1437360 RepID=A0A1M5S4M9_9BRAD|nr:copper homeostasis membrane protein CopD [Bradyrhizobium erythrophlei]SHH33439.1 putative copper resistance protein D [Bradyrhizobium erythrophlei]